MGPCSELCNQNVWFAISAISFDCALRLLLALYRNIRLRRRRSCNGTKIIGHQVDVRAMDIDVTVVIIKDVHLRWKAGQHLHLWVPRLGLLESHPFTIATPCMSSKGCHCNKIQVAIRVQAGFLEESTNTQRRLKGHRKVLLGSLLVRMAFLRIGRLIGRSFSFPHRLFPFWGVFWITWELFPCSASSPYWLFGSEVILTTM
jgi:hypothetical protein